MVLIMDLLLWTVLTFLFIITLFLFKEYPRALNSDMKSLILLFTEYGPKNGNFLKPDSSKQNCHI